MVRSNQGWGARLRLPLLAALVACAALIAGCGGGGGASTDEDALRTKIENAAQKVTDVGAVDVSLDFQVSLDEESSSESVGGCLILSVDQRKPDDESDDRFDMKAVEDGCDGGAASAEVIAVGRDIWVGDGGGKFTPGKVDPGVLTELTDDTTDFDQLAEAAEDISEASEPGTFDEPNGGTGEGPKYEFKAPASALSQTEDVGDVDVDFTTTVDKKGYLRELVGNVSAEGATAVITVKYENVGQVESIEAPAQSEVSGQPQQIHSSEELEALLEGSFGNAF